MSPIDVAYPLPLLILGVSAVAAIFRALKGPTLLDRIIAADVLIIVITSIVIVTMIVNQDTYPTVLVIVASLIGFMGSVTVARFVLERSRIGDQVQEERKP